MPLTSAEKSARWRAKNPGCDRRYYEANRESIIKKTGEARKRRVASDPEARRLERERYKVKRNARSRERFADDPAFRAAMYDSAAIRRARKRGADAERVLRDEIIARDKSRCHLCGKRVPKDQIHMDHIVPLAVRGSHTAANVAVACALCNVRKGDRPANDQLRLVG